VIRTNEGRNGKKEKRKDEENMEQRRADDNPPLELVAYIVISWLREALDIIR
jgi:hypothetical protein